MVAHNHRDRLKEFKCFKGDSKTLFSCLESALSTFKSMSFQFRSYKFNTRKIISLMGKLSLNLNGLFRKFKLNGLVYFLSRFAKN